VDPSPNAATPDALASALVDVVRELLRRSHVIGAHEIVPLLRRLTGPLGVRDAELYLLDLDQRLLVPMPPSERGAQRVDASVSGRAFRSVRPVTVAAPEGDGVRVYVPALDGAERLGVLALTAPEAVVDVAVVAALEDLASLLALLVVSKQPIGDLVARTRRVQPMDVAAEVRWMTVPPMSFQSERVGLAGVLRPAYGVAGDAFDFAVDPDVLHLAVFDAVGHTLTSARVADLALSVYRHGRREGASLDELYRRIDEVLRAEIGEDLFVTALLCRLQLDTGKLEWVCAGHPAPIRLRGTSAHELDGPRSWPLGLGGEPPPLGWHDLEPGDRIVLYSDGVLDARLPGREAFGAERLADHLGRVGGTEEVPAETLRRLANEIQDLTVELPDDFTLVVVHWTGA